MEMAHNMLNPHETSASLDLAESFDNADSIAGLWYCVTPNSIFDIKHGNIGGSSHWENEQLQASVCEVIHCYVFPMFNITELNIYTVVKHNGIIYRGHPKYKKHAWQDWVYVNCDNNVDIRPCHILCFIDLSRLPVDVVEQAAENLQPGIYALMHTLSQPLDSVPTNLPYHDFKAHQDSRLFYWATKQMSNHSRNSPKVILCNIKAFVQPCIAVPGNLHERFCDSYLFLKPRKVWPDILSALMEYTLRQAKTDKIIYKKQVGPIYET